MKQQLLHTNSFRMLQQDRPSPRHTSRLWQCQIPGQTLWAMPLMPFYTSVSSDCSAWPQFLTQCLWERANSECCNFEGNFFASIFGRVCFVFLELVLETCHTPVMEELRLSLYILLIWIPFNCPPLLNSTNTTAAYCAAACSLQG